MTKENAKDYLPLVQALAEGKVIQYFNAYDDAWIDISDPYFNDDIKNYRIKLDELWYVVKHTNGQLGIVDNDRMETVDYLYSAIKKEDCERWIADHKPQYVPFDSVEELIDCWNQKKNKGKPTYDTKLNMPMIWVKAKALLNSPVLITAFCKTVVFVCTHFVSLGELFDNYTFLDGSPIGKIKDKE